MTPSTFTNNVHALVASAALLTVVLPHNRSHFAPKVAMTEDYCVQAIEPSYRRESGNYPVPDGLFEGGHFALAALAYYQTFSCPRSVLFRGVNGHVFDANDFEPFKAALLTAVKGNYTEAASELEKLKIGLPQFTEAGYLAGVFRWSAGNRRAAIHLWRETIAGQRFALPDTDTDSAQLAAARLLKWARTK